MDYWGLVDLGVYGVLVSSWSTIQTLGWSPMAITLIIPNGNGNYDGNLMTVGNMKYLIIMIFEMESMMRMM